MRQKYFFLFLFFILFYSEKPLITLGLWKDFSNHCVTFFLFQLSTETNAIALQDNEDVGDVNLAVPVSGWSLLAKV